jgi:hypothetical protein
MRKSFSIGAVLMFVSAILSASVTVDPTTGTGFVGKGDVQLAFGWNNKQLQDNAGALTFTYKAQEQYKYDCTFTVEVGRDKVREPRTQNRGKDTSLNASVQYDARTQKQITGFLLTGLGTVTTTGGEVPVDGGSCPGGQFNDGVISNVELVSSTPGGLYVNHGGNSVLLQ